jgi:hypothetical protein
MINSSCVSYPPQTPFGSGFCWTVLYLIVQPITGDDERGDVDATDDEALELEWTNELLFELIFLYKNIQIFTTIK